MRTENLTLNESYGFMLSNSSVEIGANLIECVLMGDRDMFDNSNQVTNGYMAVRIREPDFTGDCTINQVGSLRYTRYGALYDIRHMVAFENDSNNIENYCVEIELISGVAKSGGVNVHVFCYYSGGFRL